MYQVSRLNLESLNAQQRDQYAQFTEAKYASCLDNKNPYGVSNTTQIAIAATAQGIPVGLLLASEMNYLHFAELYSIFVAEAHRHQGIAAQMLSLFETELKKLSCTFVTLVYSEKDPTASYLEKLLKKFEWSSPRLFGIHCSFDVPAFNAPWYRKPYTLSKEFELFPWVELKTKEKEKLLRQYEQGVFGSSVTPFGEEEAKIESINSLGLRYRDEVIGWMVTHRIAEDTIRYSSFFVQKAFQYQKEVIILLCKSIQLQQASSVRWGVLEINVSQVEPSWLWFVRRRLIPYADSSYCTKQSHKLLTAGR